MEYILFNQSSSKGSTTTSFANSNICLGILHNSKMQRIEDGSFTNQKADGLHTYLSGMYLRPHVFCTDGLLDEICIDFTPLGYYQFFDFPIKEYILEENILNEGLGREAEFFFEGIFDIHDLEKRGQKIEVFLLAKLRYQNDHFTSFSFSVLDGAGHCNISSIIKQLNCSERKLQRSFSGQFDITPKQFLRIKRFRKTLNEIQKKSRNKGLTMTAYEQGYADQSHLNKEIKSFTNLPPLKLRKSLVNIDQKVLVSV